MAHSAPPRYSAAAAAGVSEASTCGYALEGSVLRSNAGFEAFGATTFSLRGKNAQSLAHTKYAEIILFSMILGRISQCGNKQLD